MTARLVVSGCLAGFVVLSTGVHAQTKDRGMTVFVTAAPMAETRVDEEARKIVSARTSAAIQARKDLEKTLKAQHGGKRDKWPADANEALEEAEEAVAASNADWVYRTKQAGLANSVEDIKRAVAGYGVGTKENVVVVQSLNEAQLVVEVTGRRSGKTAFALAGQDKAGQDKDDEFWITFLVKAGPKLSADRFAAVPRDYQLRRVRYNVARLATARPESPQWRFEAYNVQSWFHAGNAVAILIEDFIAKNYDAMTAVK